MKRIAAIALFVLASLITAGTAKAQDHAVQATVPFNFTVSGSIVPAGTYTIRSSATSPNVLNVTAREKSIHILVMGQTDSSDPGTDNKLVFHKYGNQYFLSEIRSGASSMNIHFPTSKLEKRARQQRQEAGLRVNDNVLIALN